MVIWRRRVLKTNWWGDGDKSKTDVVVWSQFIILGIVMINFWCLTANTEQYDGEKMVANVQTVLWAYGNNFFLVTIIIIQIYL